MKIEIWNDPKEEKEPIIRLRLEYGSDGIVMLVAVKEDGKRMPAGNLATISADGIKLFAYVSSDIGFRLDNGRMALRS